MGITTKHKLIFNSFFGALMLLSGSLSYAEEVPLECTERLEEQWLLFENIVDKVTAKCQEQNTLQEEDGLPHCGILCQDSLIRVFESGSVDVEVQVGNRSSSSSFSSGSFSSFKPKSSSTSGNNDVTFNVKLSFKIPLGPTETLTCSNPLNSQAVTQFASLLMTAPWVLESFEEACKGK